MQLVRLDCEKCGILYGDEVNENNHVCQISRESSEQRSESPAERDARPPSSAATAASTPEKMLDDEAAEVI